LQSLERSFGTFKALGDVLRFETIFSNRMRWCIDIQERFQDIKT